MKIVTVLALVLAAITCASYPGGVATDSSYLPAGWAIAPDRKQNPGLWYCAGFGGSWRIIKDKVGNIAIADQTKVNETQPRLPPNVKLSPNMAGKRSVLEVSDGWLIGLDAGEWGGGLWWFSRDGRTKQKLLSDNVKSIYNTSKGTLVLTGLAHLDHDDGSVYRFTDTADKISVRWLSKLGRAPEASTLDEAGDVIVATMNSILRVTPDGNVMRIFESEEHLIYPTSVQVGHSGVITVGMRFFVLRLIPNDKGDLRGEWLMPQRCTTFKLSNNICGCTGN
jgi:hypothetical protein